MGPVSGECKSTICFLDFHISQGVAPRTPDPLPGSLHCDSLMKIQIPCPHMYTPESYCQKTVRGKEKGVEVPDPEDSPFSGEKSF